MSKYDGRRNPSKKAVALQYDVGDGAPVIVASGMGYMADMFKKYNADCTTKARVYIPSADSDYAEQMKQKILEIRPDCEVVIGWVGPVIGAHTGAGMVGVCFLSDKPREV